VEGGGGGGVRGEGKNPKSRGKGGKGVESGPWVSGREGVGGDNFQNHPFFKDVKFEILSENFFG